VLGEGRAARARIETARRQVAALVGADPSRVIFTSGGTEANVTALSPRMRVGAGEIAIDRLVIGATEHPSVLAGGRFSADRIRKIAVDENGRLDLDGLRTTLEILSEGGERVLVSVMLANNETGTIQPVAEIAEIAHSFGFLVHTDAVQAVGRIPVDIVALGVDLLTLSAHKIGGPQGAGALVLGGDLVSPVPLITGGGQEKYSRAGTENVAAIVGFGVAARLALADLDRAATWAYWQEIIELSAAPAWVVGGDAERLPQTISLAVDGLSAETLVIALDLEGIAVSAGSACSSGKVAVSHVMKAMNVPESSAKSAIRVSFGWETTENDIRRFTEVWGRVMERLAPAATRAA
jgi:cysteine desulfurase